MAKDKTEKAKAIRIPQSFMKAAEDFEQSKIDNIKKQNSIYKVISIAAVSLAILAVISAMIAIMARKEPEPFVLKVDTTTGATEIMRSIKDTSENYDEVVNRYWLAKYIRTCETYDWFTISEQFEACKLMSEDHVANEYAINVQSPNSPLTLLKDKGKIAVKIISITFFGNTASVRFTTQKLNSNGENIDGSPVQRKIATIAYHYKSGYMTDQQRLINPLGFKVASYRVDFEAAP